MSASPRKGVFLRIMAGTLALIPLGMAVWMVVLYVNHGFLRLDWGVLPTAQDTFLDGSGSLFQEVSWHLGNATRTWGETYGVKIHRCYLSMQVTHVNPHITPAEAKE